MNAQAKNHKANLLRLCFGQFCAYIHAPSLIFSVPIIGYTLAPNEGLATLPIALLTVAMVASIPFINKFMKKQGRRQGYLLGSSLIILSSLGCFLALIYESFIALCLFVPVSGISGAFTQTYRFAVLESSDEDKKGRNISFLLLGGVAGGFSGPLISNLFTNSIESTPFAASFLALAFVGLISFFVLFGLNFDSNQSVDLENENAEKKEKFKINIYFLSSALCGALAYGIMSLLMTATPVVMHHHHHYSLTQTAFVIQSHVVAMFLPSLFTGILIDKIGSRTIMVLGVIILLLCSVSALNGVLLTNFWVALVLLGVGWNFLFVSATVAVSKTYKHNQRYEAQSLNDLIVFSINAMGALSSAWLLNLIGWEMMQTLAIIIIGFISALIYFTKKRAFSS